MILQSKFTKNKPDQINSSDQDPPGNSIEWRQKTRRDDEMRPDSGTQKFETEWATNKITTNEIFVGED